MLWRFSSIFFWAIAVSLPSLAESEPLQRGAMLAEEECQECHGKDGRSHEPSIPSIGGFSETAILDLLQTYKEEARPAQTIELEDGTETNMYDVVESLSAEELETIANYYANLDWQPIDQWFDKDMAKQGARIHGVKCGKCHLREGRIPESDHAILAGQWREYLEIQFEDFSNGARRMASKMQQKFDSLSDRDKELLLELYVSAGQY